MKTYTGLEAIERMKTHWIVRIKKESFFAYKIEDSVVYGKEIENGRVVKSLMEINHFFENEFVDYVEPLKVGDWVVREDSLGIHTFKITQVLDEFYVFEGLENGKYAKTLYRKATPEEVKQEKRRRVFAKVGRNIDEFKNGDCVCKDAYADYMKVIEVSEDGIVRCSFYDGEIDDERSIWVKAKVLKLVYVIENIVKEDE